MRETLDYYNSLSKGYDELYSEEQMGKSDLIKFADGRVLDVGCGTSILTKLINGNFVVGLDLSRSMIKKGRASGISYVVGRAEALPFKNRSFDSVVSITVLQDCKNAERAMSEIARVSSKAVISVPSKSRLDLKKMAEGAKLEIIQNSAAGKDRFVYVKK